MLGSNYMRTNLKSTIKHNVSEEIEIMPFTENTPPHEIDVRVAKYIVNKVDSCRKRGIEWKLSFTSVKNLMKSKRCYYTKIPLKFYDGVTENSHDFTIDRIDNKLPYQAGNVVACSRWANKFKSSFENPSYEFDMKDGYNVLKKTLDRMSK